MAVVRPQVVHFGSNNSRRRGCSSKRKSSYSYRVQSDTGVLTARSTSTGISGGPVHVLGPVVTSHHVGRDHDA